ncbi:MAG TPA: OmpA family protein [Rhizomicrobium sp.]|nr:OmpA family protein [Rhizomicrobium sp.]
MVLDQGRLPKYLARVATVVVIAGGAAGCSSMPDWVDPTTWGGGNTETSGQQMDQQTPADQTAANAPTPDLSTIPDKPAAPSTSDEQKQVADSLQADRSHNQYSADALRGGTEAAAAPPPATPPPEATDVAPTAGPNASAATAPAPPPAAAPAPEPAPATQTASTDNGAIDATGAPGPDETAPAAASPVPAAAPAVNSSNAAVPAVPSGSGAVPATQMAMAQEPSMTPSSSGGLPAVPADSGMAAGVPTQPSDADLGFQPSKAPPLDPSVSQFVPQPIIARYQQTSVSAPSSGAAVPSSAGPAIPAVPPGKPMGGPEAMSGAVVANFDSLQTAAVAPSSVAGLPPTAIVFFPHDTTILNASGKAQVRAAVEAFQSAGGQGFIRVVGHSSSRTSNMPLARHLIFNFERSQARANAVARELIAEGVPASKVLVEAVGDSQPVYYESMPQGEEGNRRAEIFLQS